MKKILTLLTTLTLVSGSVINVGKYQTNTATKLDGIKTKSLLTKSNQKPNNNHVVSKANPNFINLFSNSGGKLIGHDATESEIRSFSNLAINYEFFTKLGSDKAFGYTDFSYNGGSGGLCEYISLGTILEYYELFVSSGIFTDSEWKKYFASEEYSNQPSLPYHNNYRGTGFDNNLSYNLFQINGYYKDVKFGSIMLNTFTNFLKNKPIALNMRSDTCAELLHTSNPEDYLLSRGIPVMVSFVAGGGHNVIIYGYDKATNSYLVHYGWAGHPAVVIKKSDIWSFWSAGFWNAFWFNAPEQDRNPTRQAFRYKGELYSWKELTLKGIGWDQVERI